MKIVSAFLLLFATVSITVAQNGVTEKIIKLAREDNRAMHHLDILSNRIGGRPIGSDAYANATRWTADQMKKWGMEVIVEQVGTLPVGFNRGAWFGKMLSDDGFTLHFVTPSYTSGTKGVQRGTVVAEPKTKQELEQMRGALKGAWVLVGGKSNGWPIDYSAKGDSVRKEALKYNDSIAQINRQITSENRANRSVPHYQSKPTLPYKEQPALFYREMVEAGILGFIQSAPVPLQALYDRNVFGDMSFDNLPTVPDIKLDEAQFAIIAEKVRRREYFQLEFDIRNHFKPGPVAYHNVIGIIRGTKYPDEYVMAGGHLDSFDVSTGGVDCGSGSSVALEAGRMIMEAGGNKPLRSIAICLWAGEEFGLLGSKFWVENHTNLLPKISNYFNRDGGPTVANSLTVTPAMYPVFEPIADKLNAINPDFPFSLTKSENQPRPRPTTAGGSDHAYFAMNGVPTLSFGTADPKGYDFQYGEIWHTERDLYNKSISEYQEHSAVVTAVTLWELANTKSILARQGLYSN